MKKSRPARLGAIAVVATTSLLTLTAVRASASPPSRAGVGGLHPNAKTAVQTATLITGDTVRITGTMPGQQQVDVVPAPRADGDRPSFLVSENGGDVTVIPRDVAALIPTRLDPQLFDLTTLLAQGYGTSATRLIVTYRGAAAKPAALRSAVLPGATTTRALPSVGGTAVQVDPRSAGDLGRTLDALAERADRPNSAAGDIDKIWLDQRVRAGAGSPPTGHSPGPRATDGTVAVLDTGVDATQPDLLGQVAAAKNFTPARDVADHAGHGTSAATTIAGTGATLVNGKVLDDSGIGYESSVIAGLEWASTQQHASIVNLGVAFPTGASTSGPVARAFQRLTAANDTLFVTPADERPCDSCADVPGVLTVGAADDARANATDGQTGSDVVTPGRSPAPAQVSAAAAAVLAAHPNRSAAQLKAVLMGSARVTPYGAGRVDVVAGLRDSLVPSTGSIELGRFSYPQRDRVPVQRPLTYSNATDHAVTVTLASESTGPRGIVTVAPRTLTVPAGSRSTAIVTVDTMKGGTGPIRGSVTATAPDGSTTRTRVDFDNEPQMYDVTINAIARDGRAAAGFFQIFDVDAGRVAAARVVPGTATAPCTDATYAESTCIKLPAGRYSVMGLIYTMPPGVPSTVQTRTVLNSSLVGNPELTIDHDTTLTMDARSAKEVHVDTPDHPDATANSGGALDMGFTRTAQTGATMGTRVWNSPGTQIQEKFFEQPTAQVTVGQFSAFVRMRLEQPMLTMTVAGRPKVSLAPAYYDPVWFSDLSSQYPYWNRTAKLRVVDAGTATPSEIARHNLQGALALVRRSDAIPVGEQSNNAAAAGARFVAIYNDGPGDNPDPGAVGIRLKIPTVRLSHEEGTALLARLGSHAVTVQAVGHTASPYLYDLVFRQQGGLPNAPDFVADRRSTATVVRDIAGEAGSAMTYSDVGYPFLPGETASYSTTFPVFGAPRQRTDYYVADPDVRWSYGVHSPEDVHNNLWPEPQAGIGLTSIATTTYRPGERRVDRWFGGPIAAGLYSRQPLQRAGNVMRVYLAAFIDSTGNWGDGWTTDPPEPGLTTEFRMYAGDTLVAETGAQAAGTVTVPAEAADYRIDYDVDNAAPWARLSTHTSTEWTFHSAPPADGVVATEPLIVADYDLDADQQNVVRKGGGAVPFGVNLTHQAGAAQPAVTSVGVDASYDDGKTWHATKIRSSGAGHYTASIEPRVSGHRIGYVSLRVHAADANGATFEQRIIRAFAVSGAIGPGGTR